jgi:hypothetical protein
MNVFPEDHTPEETRLKYRFLDLRRSKLHQTVMLRAKVISSIRQRMIELGFQEFQTPILTSSSPEGARDFLVPSRLLPRRILRAAPGAAAVQAAPHGQRLRPLFPDRALFSATRTAAPTAPRRVLPARRRDELRHAGGCLQGDGRFVRRSSRNFPSGPMTPRTVRAHSLQGIDAEVRHRQARFADSDRDSRTSRRSSPKASSRLSPERPFAPCRAAGLRSAPLLVR